MRKRAGIFALFLLSALCLFAAEAGAKPRLAVRTFDNKTGRGSFSAPAQAITDMMTTELHNAGIFSLMEREKLDFVADEIRLGQSGLVDPSTAPEVGKIKGAQYTMTGAITVYFYNAGGGAVVLPGMAGVMAASRTAYVTLDIRVIDNTTSEVVYAAAADGKAQREAAGVLTRYGGFASANYGGILASATRDSVAKHVAAMRQYDWE
jgi:curli biogenesis system outer membrane secretion channel CsgG